MSIRCRRQFIYVSIFISRHCPISTKADCCNSPTAAFQRRRYHSQASNFAQEQNREDALARLAALIKRVSVVQKARKATKPTFSSTKTHGRQIVVARWNRCEVRWAVTATKLCRAIRSGIRVAPATILLESATSFYLYFGRSKPNACLSADGRRGRSPDATCSLTLVDLIFIVTEFVRVVDQLLPQGVSSLVPGVGYSWSHARRYACASTVVGTGAALVSEALGGRWS